MSNWYLYIVKCSDDSLYTGITKDVDRRIEEHNSNDQLGARYTRGRRPVNLVYLEEWQTRSEVSKREFEVKRLCKKDKLVLINSSKDITKGNSN